MKQTQEQLSIFCHILLIIALLDFIGGSYMLFLLWETSHYVAIMWFVSGLISALFFYAISQIITLLANIKKNTGKTQEYLELLIKSLSKK